jgi:hypothetical protein
MTIDEEDPNLEVLVHRALRRLPLRQAPLSLQERVWSELARAASLPWWRRSFVYWPIGASVAFFVLSVGLSALTIGACARVVAGLAPMLRLADSMNWIFTAADAFRALLHAVPPSWLYEGLAAAGMLYGFLFTLGAVAYRTLYLEA